MSELAKMAYGFVRLAKTGAVNANGEKEWVATLNTGGSYDDRLILLENLVAKHEGDIHKDGKTIGSHTTTLNKLKVAFPGKNL